MATKYHTAPVAPTGAQFADDAFQRDLARWNHARLLPSFPGPDWELGLARDHRMLRLEGHFIEAMREEVKAEAAEAPTDADGFVAWFEALKEAGPGQSDPFFPWLAETADFDQLRWFLRQEAAGEAGFDDLVAYSQVKLPEQAKLEMARNYWDEMGRGNPKGMHGPMLDILVQRLDLDPSIDTTLWQSLALANAMTAMAVSRRYAWHSVGALGAIELTAPTRAIHVAAALRRHGLNGRERHYFDLHSVLDVKHSEAWNEEVLHPLVREDPRRAPAIAEGALMRLHCGARCFEAYRAHLWSE